MKKTLAEELEELRGVHAKSPPAARLKVIRQTLARASQEPGAMRLVTVVSAVEALARSLVVHSLGRPASTADIRYKQYRHATPMELVTEVFRLRGAAEPASHFVGDTWELFNLAHDYRNLVVHECTSPGQDNYPTLIAATEAVLGNLIEVGGLPRLVD